MNKKVKYLSLLILSTLFVLMMSMTAMADDCDHSWVYSQKVDATCNDQGYTLYVCSKCGEEKKDSYVNALGHDYEYKANNNGTHTGTCTRCGKQVTEYCVEYYKDYVTAPTCEEKGYTSHICSQCGYVLVDTYVDPLGHNYVWTNNGDGTCTGICTRNSSHKVTKSHDFETTVVDPTCTTSGYTAHICKNCGYEVDDDYVAATGHDYAYTSNGNGTHIGVCKNNPSHTTKANCTYETRVVAPTCEEQGYTLHTCTVCGYSYKDNYTAALGHSHVYTSTNDGYHYVQCENDPSENYREKCNYTETVIAPTCESAGYTLYKCTECGYTYKGNYTAALCHDYTWVTANDGTHVGTCNNDPSHIVREQCNYITTVTKAKATSAGYTTHICSVCGYTYVDGYVAPLGHDYVYTDLGNGTHRVTDNNDPDCNYIENCTYTTTVVNATCTTQGYTRHICQKCGHYYDDQYVPATGHNYVYTAVNTTSHKAVCQNDASHVIVEAHTDVTKVVPATCTTDGYTLHTCSVCGYTWKTDTVEATGHTWTWIIDKAGTSTSNGTMHKKCTTCGATQSKVVIGKLLPSISKVTNTKQTIKWTKVTGATKYVVYGMTCNGKNTFIYSPKLKTTTGTSVTISGLKKGTYYKYYVVAYCGSKKMATSYEIHGTTSGSAYGNNTSVSANKSSVSIKKSKTTTLKTTVNSSKTVKYHISKVRYYSSNTSVATVNQTTGKITAKKKGTCYIYCVAQNGKRTKVKVTVK